MLAARSIVCVIRSSILNLASSLVSEAGGVQIWLMGANTPGNCWAWAGWSLHGFAGQTPRGSNSGRQHTLQRDTGI